MNKLNDSIFILSLSCMLFHGCSNLKSKKPAAGADKDSNGCIGSAGYQWSSIQKNCIRSFELPIQLTNAEKTFSAGVILSEDNKQAEVFTKDGVFILTEQSEMLYVQKSEKEGFFLKKNNNKWEFGKLSETKAEYVEIDK